MCLHAIAWVYCSAAICGGSVRTSTIHGFNVLELKQEPDCCGLLEGVQHAADIIHTFEPTKASVCR